MIYLIFKEGKFKGFAEDKKEIKKFLETRGKKYSIEKIEENQFAELYKRNKQLDLYRLSFYPEYQSWLFGYEANRLWDVLSQRFMEIHRLYLDINRCLIYIKLDDEEKEAIEKFFHIIEMMSDDLMGHDLYAPFNEYFNIDSIVKILTHNN